MNIPRILLVLIGEFFISSPLISQDHYLSNGTIIITLISNDTIWVGADSRTSSLTNKGYTVNKEGMCKIHSTDQVVYAMAGHVRYTDNSFNFLEIMKRCVNEQADFEKSMELFQQRTQTEIKSILKRFSRKSINTLVTTNNGSFLSVIAISFVNGERKTKEMKFSVQSAGGKNWKVIYKVAAENSGGNLRFLGHARRASDYIKDHNLFFGNGKNIPNKIRELINIEAEGTITVGMPADVISIYDGGYKRVISSGLCP